MSMNRKWGCSSRTGFGNTDACKLYREHLVCTPECCNHSDSNLHPQFLRVGEWRCRNVDLIRGQHKRTFVSNLGKNGFGHFSLHHFEAGELIGHYACRTAHAKKVDLVLRTSDAKQLSYTFDLTRTMSIDGQCFESKVRFITHSSSAKHVNCAARFERMR